MSFFFLSPTLYINYPCTRSNNITSAASSPALAPLRRLSVTCTTSPFTHNSDQDALADSESDGDDDEYIPFIETNPQKHSRSSIPV